VNFAAALDRVEAILAGGPWRSAVAGGVALAAYGNPRVTLDLDIVTEAAAQPALVSALEAAGYRTLYRSTGFSNHLHPEREWGRLDFIYVDEPTASRLFAGVREVRGPGDRPIKVPRPEHLIAMKVQAIKNTPERSMQDLADISYLLHLSGIDRDEVRTYFDRAGLLSRWEALTHGQ
jgi:hypothetical protein